MLCYIMLFIYHFCNKLDCPSLGDHRVGLSCDQGMTCYEQFHKCDGYPTCMDKTDEQLQCLQFGTLNTVHLW